MSAQTKKKNLLIIDDDRIFSDSIRDYFETAAVQTFAAYTAKEGLAICSRERIDVVLLDQQLPDADGYTLCSSILKSNEETKIIFVTAYPSFENAVKALKEGAHDYLIKPFELEELRLAVERAIRTAKLEEIERIQAYRREKESEETVLIGGQGLADVMRLVDLAAGSDSPVLITGETGTGKTLVARAIHYRSSIAEAPFVGINCAALPENLIEAELFGYEKGAYTGAVSAKKGIFEMADGGTLFLDEIGEMPLLLQTKLLSTIEDKSVTRLGSESFRRINVRIIAATGISLEEALGNTFRKDLYYRLSVIRIHMPPLRERRQDIPGLCDYLLKRLGYRFAVLSAFEQAELMNYHWPGNVRELKNILERAALLQQGPELRPSLLLDSEGRMSKVPHSAPSPDEGGSIISLQEMEKKHIRMALDRLSGNVTQSARILGISLSTLKRKIREYGLK